jgi:hypothetical protein
VLRHSVPAGTECPIKFSNFSPTYADDLQRQGLGPTRERTKDKNGGKEVLHGCGVVVSYWAQSVAGIRPHPCQAVLKEKLWRTAFPFPSKTNVGL